MLNIKPNQIVRMGTIVGVVEGMDIYRPNVWNIYNSTTSRSFPVSEISEVISEVYCEKPLFAFQVYNLIK